MPKTVLLVEDEDTIAYALQFLIEREGFTCRRAASAGAARTALREERPALILLDVTLPGGSGYELCQEVRGDAALSDVKILMMTASGDPMAERKSLALGADAFVSKPFANADMNGKIQALMQDAAA